jgi:hypothetical protein
MSLEAYTCAACGLTFFSPRPEAEARAEVSVVFGCQWDPTDVRVCEDCYKRLMRAANS